MKSLSRSEGEVYTILESGEHEEELFLVKGLAPGSGNEIERASCLGSLESELENLNAEYVGGKTMDGEWSASENTWDGDDLRLYNFYGTILGLELDQQNRALGEELEEYVEDAFQNSDMVSRMDQLYEDYRQESESIRSVKL